MKIIISELEKKRIFQIKLRAILSFIKPESIEFLKNLNECNKDLRFDLVASVL